MGFHQDEAVSKGTVHSQRIQGIVDVAGCCHPMGPVAFVAASVPAAGLEASAIAAGYF